MDAYTDFASVYDTFMDETPYEMWADFLQQILKENQISDGLVLDLGCGYGVVGIFAAKMIGQENVIMCDISSQAVKCSRENAVLNGVPEITVLESNGFAQITDRDFTLILSNPPYHADFSVPKHFIEEGYKRLKLGGRLVMVTKRLEWYKRKFISVFGGVQIFRVEDYFVFVGEKRCKIRKPV